MHGPVAVAMAQVAGIAARLPVDRLEGSFLLPLALAFEREWRIRAVLSDGSSFNWWTPKKPNRTMVVARQLCLLTALLAFPWTVLGPFGALSFVDTSLCYKRWSCRREWRPSDGVRGVVPFSAMPSVAVHAVPLPWQLITCLVKTRINTMSKQIVTQEVVCMS